VIQRRLGHASIRTTADIYGSLPERVDRPVAAKLDDLFRQAVAECGADVVQMWCRLGARGPVLRGQRCEQAFRVDLLGRYSNPLTGLFQPSSLRPLTCGNSCM